MYGIGTEIIIFHCFATKMLKSFCKSIIFSGIESSRRDLAFYSIKTRFKTFRILFFEKLHAALDSRVLRFLGTLPLEGD